MRPLFALLLIIVGVAQLSATSRQFDGFNVHSAVGDLADKYPMTKRDKMASDKAVQHVEYFRRFIHNGIGSIPPMDPYTRDALKPIFFDGNSTNLIGMLQVTDLMVTGGAAFSVDTMEVYLNTHRMDFEMTIPQVVARAHFSAVNMIYHGFMFNTSGDVEVTLDGYRAKGAVSMFPSPSTGHYMAQGMDVRVAVGGGSYTTSTPIGNPTDKDLMDVRNAMYDAISVAVCEDMTSALGGYTVQQVDIFMEP